MVNLKKMYMVKRDGRTEEVHFDKKVLTNRTSPGTLGRQLIDNIITRRQKDDLEVKQNKTGGERT